MTSITPLLTFHNQKAAPYSCPVLEHYKPTDLLIAASHRGPNGTIGIRATWENGRANAPGCGEVTVAMSIPLATFDTGSYIGARRADVVAVTTDPLIGESSPAELTNTMVHGLIAELDDVVRSQKKKVNGGINLDANAFVARVHELMSGITNDKLHRPDAPLKIRTASLVRS